MHGMDNFKIRVVNKGRTTPPVTQFNNSEKTKKEQYTFFLSLSMKRLTG
jgi:hypothetical protein